MAVIKQEESAKAQWLVVKAIGLIILIGTLLLMLPWARSSADAADPLSALFMATSAVCVTGHTLFVVPEYYTLWGKLILLLLIQTGGIGFMMLGTVFLTLAGRRMSMQNEMALLDVLRIEEARNLKSLLGRTLLFSFLFEAGGAAIFTWRFHADYGQPLSVSILNGIFHSVSAYCNAGFSLFNNSFMGFRNDPVIVITAAVLIVLGGLGFIVLYDLSSFKFWRRNRLRRGQLMLHTRIALAVSAFLIVAGAAAFAAMEWNRTLASLPWPSRIMDSVFHSITARTAGFNLVNMAQTAPATRFFNLALMFIGGSPGSTAGGIKTTTAAVLLAATIAMIRGRREITVPGRTIPLRNTEEALAIFMLGFIILTGLCLLLLISEHSRIQAGVFTADYLLFDTVSAFGTVGLSTGIMPMISRAGQIIVTLCMFIGRVGPLTIAMLVSLKSARNLVRTPEEDVMVG